MSKAILYDSQGHITGEIFGPEASLYEYIEASVDSGLIVEADCSADTHYVDGGEIREKSPQPSGDYIFDYQTKSWVWDINLAKKHSWSLIKAERDGEEFGTFEWSGHTFQCDEVSQRRIQGAVQLAAIDPAMTLDWTLADNSVQTFTAAEYIQIGQALANHVSQCHERGRILRQQIQSATTQEELEAIAW